VQDDKPIIKATADTCRIVFTVRLFPVFFIGDRFNDVKITPKDEERMKRK